MGRNCFKILVLLISFILFVNDGFARGKGKYNNVSQNVYMVDVLDVIDGDTFFAEIFYSPTISEKVNIRVAGVDTPEIGKANCDDERALGIKAKKFYEKLLLGQKVFIKGVGLDKYAGRLVADVYLGDITGDRLSDNILDSGLSSFYSGKGKKFDWCG